MSVGMYISFGYTATEENVSLMSNGCSTYQAASAFEVPYFEMKIPDNLPPTKAAQQMELSKAASSTVSLRGPQIPNVQVID